MRGCDPASAAAKLEAAMEALQLARAEVAPQWDDPVSRDFEKQFLAPLEPKVKRALEAIHHLVETLSRAERDCAQ
jgi:hypothetical protein